MKQATMHWVWGVNVETGIDQYLITNRTTAQQTRNAMKAHSPYRQTVHYHNQNTLLVSGTASGQMHT